MIDQASRDAWAACLREERRLRERPAPRPPGYPRSWWNERARERADEGDLEPWDYDWHRDQYLEKWFAGAQGALSEKGGHWMGSSAYQDGLDWLEAHDKDGWWDMNLRLVEQGRAPGRGRSGPFYPRSWWYDTAYEDDGIRRTAIRMLTVPESKLPKDLNQRIILLALTHIRGATVRWAIRRKLGRTTDQFYDDCSGELGSVGSCYVPWIGAGDDDWLDVHFNGTGQEGHGYSKHFAIRVGDWGNNQVKINHKQIVPLARRVFKVPDIYRESVDEETGQATLF
jgi:hypothetical protein